MRCAQAGTRERPAQLATGLQAQWLFSFERPTVESNMSIELFWIDATVSSGTVTVTVNEARTPGFPPTTSFQLQRKPFGYGQDQWANVGASQATVAGTLLYTFTDAPGVGDWSYRIQATVTQGGVDNAGTQLSSIEVNVTTEPATGQVTLVLGSQPAGDPVGYTLIKLGWYITPLTVDVLRYEVQRSVNGGPFRTAGSVDETNTPAFQEVVPNGSGLYAYQVVAHLPASPTVSQYQGNSPYGAGNIVSTSNQVSVTV